MGIHLVSHEIYHFDSTYLNDHFLNFSGFIAFSENIIFYVT